MKGTQGASRGGDPHRASVGCRALRGSRARGQPPVLDFPWGWRLSTLAGSRAPGSMIHGPSLKSERRASPASLRWLVSAVPVWAMSSGGCGVAVPPAWWHARALSGPSQRPVGLQGVAGQPWLLCLPGTWVPDPGVPSWEMLGSHLPPHWGPPR